MNEPKREVRVQIGQSFWSKWEDTPERVKAFMAFVLRFAIESQQQTDDYQI